MFNRLKTLPLTIILTILIWMFAEAQFTAAQDNIRISARLVSPSPDFAVFALDEGDPKRGRPSINVVATVAGAKAQIDRLYQLSLNATPPDEDFRALAFAPSLEDLQTSANPSIDTVTVLNGLRYFRARGLTVTAATPPRIRLKIEPLTPATSPATTRPE